MFVTLYDNYTSYIPKEQEYFCFMFTGHEYHKASHSSFWAYSTICRRIVNWIVLLAAGESVPVLAEINCGNIHKKLHLQVMNLTFL